MYCATYDKYLTLQPAHLLCTYADFTSSYSRLRRIICFGAVRILFVFEVQGRPNPTPELLEPCRQSTEPYTTARRYSGTPTTGTTLRCREDSM